MLIQNAWAVAHSKDCFLAALFYRIASRRGGKRAAMAVAHRVLLIAYYIIRDGSVYHELGGDHSDRKNPERTARRLTQRLERIGYQVTLTVRGQEPMCRPILNGTTRWKDSTATRVGRGQLRIPGTIATPDICRWCASRKIPCIHGRTVQESKNTPREGAPKLTRGRPCKCVERGVICTHKALNRQATTIISRQLSDT
jgi:hypothetical protein